MSAFLKITALRVFGLSVIGLAYLVGGGGSWWSPIAAIPFMVAGLWSIEVAGVRAEQRRLMRHRWFCDVCAMQGVKAGIESSHQEILMQFQQQHIEHVHNRAQGDQ